MWRSQSPKLWVYVIEISFSFICNNTWQVVGVVIFIQYRRTTYINLSNNVIVFQTISSVNKFLKVSFITMSGSCCIHFPFPCRLMETSPRRHIMEGEEKTLQCLICVWNPSIDLGQNPIWGPSQFLWLFRVLGVSRNFLFIFLHFGSLFSFSLFWSFFKFILVSYFWSYSQL